MEHRYLKMPPSVRMIFLLLGTIVLWATEMQAQEKSMREGMSCPMCGAMGWGGMILGGFLMISVIVAFVSLSVFLVRRNRAH